MKLFHTKVLLWKVPQLWPGLSKVKVLLAIAFGLACILTFATYKTGLYSVVQETPLTVSSFTYPLDIDFSLLFRKNSGNLNSFPVINPINFKTFHDNASACTSKEPLDAFIFIKSSAVNIAARNVIRQTWLKELPHNNMRAVFITATPKEDWLQVSLSREINEFHDIVQFDHIENYYNNTLKAVMGYKWFVKHCGTKGAKYAVFFDEDYYVNVPNLRAYLKKQDQSLYDHYVCGYVFADSRPHRFNSKWFVNLTEYKWSRWPPYPTGGSYIISAPLLERIALASDYVAYLRFDDVFLGIVLWRLGVSPIDDKVAFLFDPPTLLHTYKEVVAVHMYSNFALLQQIWTALHPSG